MLRALKASALALLAMSTPGTSPRAGELSPPEIYDRVTPSTLALRVTTVDGERFVGAAFVALRPDRAVTAWHLVRDAARIDGTYSDGTTARIGPVVATSEAHDLALLDIGPSRREPLPLRLEAPRIASRLFAIGSPRGYTFSISDGLLSQVQQVDGFPQFQLTCPFSPGNSGGPIVNESAEVVGVSAWSKLGAQNLNFAIPARFIPQLQTSEPSTSLRPQGGDPTNRSPTKRPGRSAPDSPNTDDARAMQAAAAPERTLTDRRQLDALLDSLAGQELRITVSTGLAAHHLILRPTAHRVTEVPTPRHALPESAGTEHSPRGH